MSNADTGIMEVGKVQTNSKVGHVFYFIVDQLHPAHPYDNSLYCYYVLSLSSSYIDAFFFLCSKLCNVNDSELIKEWHTLFERLFVKQSLSEFLSHVKSALMQNAYQSHSNREINDNENVKQSNIASLHKNSIESAEWGKQPVLCYDRHAALIALKKLELCESIDVCTQNKVRNFTNVAKTKYACDDSNHNDDDDDNADDKISYKTKELESVMQEHTDNNSATEEGTWYANNECKRRKGNLVSIDKPSTILNVEHHECISCTPPTISHHESSHQNNSITNIKNNNNTNDMQWRKELETQQTSMTNGKQLAKDDVAQILAQNNAELRERCTNSRDNSNYNESYSNHDHNENKNKNNNIISSEKGQTLVDSSVHEMEEMIATLTNKINTLSTKYAENLKMFMINNDRTLTQLQQQYNKKEEELNRVYRVALQNRDIRIAHLTEDLWHLRRSHLELMERNKVTLHEHSNTKNYGNKETNNYLDNHARDQLSYRSTELLKQECENRSNALTSTEVCCYDNNSNMVRERWWQSEYAKVINDRNATIQELHGVKNELATSDKKLQSAYDTIAKLQTALQHIKTELPFVHQSLDELLKRLQ